MEVSTSSFVTIFTVIGLLVIVVSIITELTKSIPLLSKIPTNIQVIVLSQTLTIVTYFAYISYSGDAILWYYVVATFIVGFIVAYVVLFGWDKFIVLYRRFRNIPISDITLNTSSDTTSAKTITHNDINVDLAIDTIDTVSPANDTASTSDISTL